MKKIFLMLLAAMLLLSSSSLAEEKPAATNAVADMEITDRLTAFLQYWNMGSLDDMLNLCASGWKDKAEEPRMELFRILANRTPQSYELAEISGTAEDAAVTASVKLLMDRNNGTAPRMYLFRVILEKESDGNWYVNPDSLLACDAAEDGFPAEPTPEPSTMSPVEEYTVQAWPLNAEGYADLLNHLEDRHGQVYVVKGTVREVLTESPLRVVICTGEDGITQPVVVECPKELSFNWEVGTDYRIYADVSPASYVMPVLVARYCFSK